MCVTNRKIKKFLENNDSGKCNNIKIAEKLRNNRECDLPKEKNQSYYIK